MPQAAAAECEVGMNYLGIDLGTTNSVGCTLENGKFAYLDFRGCDLLPSAILYKDGKVTVGMPATRRSEVNPQNYISSAKTFIGDNEHIWQIDDRIFTPTDVATEVLNTIYRTAKKHFGNEDPIQVVITAPAYFSSKQIEETKHAGEAAGFLVKQVLAEPVAAALAYAFDDYKTQEKIYVVDLGGGTFDVSLLQMDGVNEFSTLMKAGDAHLGGDDFDKAVMEIMLRQIRLNVGVNLDSLEESGLKPEEYGKAMQKLKQEAERRKQELSSSETTEVALVNLFPYKGNFFDFNMEITRMDFLEEAALTIKKVENIIKHSFDNINCTREEVDRVILVGGSARMPFVRDFVKNYFGKEPYADKDLAKLVAMGAALLANDESDTITLHDIIAHSLGIEIVGKQMKIILEKDNVYPIERTEQFTTVYDYQESVDIEVYEGEDTKNVETNAYFGGFELPGIEKAKAGQPKIEVTFSYDESCILHVTARDMNTNASKSQDIKIDIGYAKKNPKKS